MIAPPRIPTGIAKIDRPPGSCCSAVIGWWFQDCAFEPSLRQLALAYPRADLPGLHAAGFCVSAKFGPVSDGKEVRGDLCITTTSTDDLPALGNMPSQLPVAQLSADEHPRQFRIAHSDSRCIGAEIGFDLRRYPE